MVAWVFSFGGIFGIAQVRMVRPGSSIHRYAAQRQLPRLPFDLSRR